VAALWKGKNTASTKGELKLSETIVEINDLHKPILNSKELNIIAHGRREAHENYLKPSWKSTTYIAPFRLSASSRPDSRT